MHREYLFCELLHYINACNIIIIIDVVFAVIIIIIIIVVVIFKLTMGRDCYKDYQHTGLEVDRGSPIGAGHLIR